MGNLCKSLVDYSYGIFCGIVLLHSQPFLGVAKRTFKPHPNLFYTPSGILYESVGLLESSSLLPDYFLAFDHGKVETCNRI